MIVTGSFTYGPLAEGEPPMGVRGRWIERNAAWTDSRFEGEVVLSKLTISSARATRSEDGAYANSVRITNEHGARESRP